MTLRLRRKRQTTVRGRNTRTRTGFRSEKGSDPFNSGGQTPFRIRLAGLLGLLLAGTASGQQPIGTPYPSYNPPPVPFRVPVQPPPFPSSTYSGLLPESVPVAQPAAPA